MSGMSTRLNDSKGAIREQAQQGIDSVLKIVPGQEEEATLI
jgi:hypothetical protein